MVFLTGQEEIDDAKKILEERSQASFEFWDPGGGAGCLPTPGPPPPPGPKMAQMAGAAGKCLNRFDTTTGEKREKCVPSAGPPQGGVPKSLGAWALPGPPPRGS